MVHLVKSLKAHTDKAWNASAHDSLPLLATSSTDKNSKIYKLSKESNFPLVATLEDTHKRSVRSVSFKPLLKTEDSQFVDLPALASGSFDSTISIWSIDEPEEMLDHEFDDNDDDYSRDNADVLMSRKRKEAEILTSSKNEWNLMALIEGHENEIKSVAWNKHGNYLALCLRDKTVWIWETDPETLEEFECICVLSDHEHDIKHIVWHPEANILASSSYDDTIRLYKQDDDDDTDWSCVAILTGHEGTVWCSAFEHPGLEVSGKSRLASASDDTTIRIWSSESPVDTKDDENALPSSLKHRSEMEWRLESTLPAVHKYAVYSVAWSATTGKIASAGADGQIAIYSEKNGVWKVESCVTTSHGVYEVNCVAWCTLQSGEEVLVSAGDDGAINIWELD